MNEIDIVITRISNIDHKYENDIRKMFDNHLGIISPNEKVDLNSLAKDYSNTVITSISNRADDFISEAEKVLTGIGSVPDKHIFKLIEAEIFNKIDINRYLKRLDNLIESMSRTYARYGVDMYKMGYRFDLVQAAHIASVKNTVRKVQRHTKAELSFLCKKMVRKKDILEKYRGLSVMQKLGIWGSIASIFGLVLTIFPFNASSENTNINNIGSKNPIITNPSGDVNINYNENKNESKRSYVLRNSQGGQPPLLLSPKLSFIIDTSKYVCTPIIGEKIQPLSERASEGGHEIWRKITVLEGDCKGKQGWVLTNDISIE